MLIIKRDGKKVPFNPLLITEAVNKACAETNVALEGMAAASHIQNMLNILGLEEVDISKVQQLVEDYLMQVSPKAARAYIEYRHDRDSIRLERSNIYKKAESLILTKDDEKLLHENANKNSETIPTMRDMLAGIVSRELGLKYIKEADKLHGKDIVKAHQEGYLHFHDSDYSPLFPIANCCLIDLENMLSKGFRMGNAEIGTPKSILTAAAVTAQIIAQVASHQYGGCSINGIDTILEPYVEKTYNKYLKLADKYQITNPNYALESTEKDVYDAMQALEYEINTLHTANGQTPFVTFGFGLGTSNFSRMIQKSILKVRILGLGENHRTAIFPKLIFAIKKGLNSKEGEPNYDIKKLAVECAARRMYPDILSYEKTIEVTGSFKFPMGCRSFLSPYYEDGKLIHDGRNNLGVVSINLPRIALESESKEEFFTKLSYYLELCFHALNIRIHRFDKVQAKVAPILYMEGAYGVRLKADDYVSEIFKNGRASVSLGYIGVYECVNALNQGKENQQLAIEIVKYLSDTCAKWKEETGYGFSLYGTPAESLCYKFCELDKNKFGEIQGVTDKGYYTNSFHQDVRKVTNPYEKLDYEKNFPKYSNGGFICFTEYPNMLHNLEALEDIWDFAMDNVPYYGTNTPVDQCFECGYEGEFTCTSKGFCCPECGCHDSEKISVIRRVCGYLGAPDSRPFNKGKQQEVMNRVKHL